ncbi:hypothetical protein OCOJLMKI_4818 [Methylobacterium iners]|uniref:Uncharacterized protein n=1 Tax=Methylobacterium iners TaxID=418707 RepID=A0ABQ4S3G4_9HYPH|nr:hypothetical protein OCOJLMKI_4818 [Methylobacterium iners]
MRFEADAVQVRDRREWRYWLVISGLFLGVAFTVAWCGMILASTWWLYVRLSG